MEKYTPKIGYKGFDKDLKCRNEQFEIGKVYYKENKENPKPCSADGYHYCNSLKDVFTYYSNDNSRYCEIEVLGNFTDEHDKSITTTFRIVKELSKEEVDKLKRFGDEKKVIENMGLETALRIQQQHPLIQIGGSLALFLHGIRLERFGNSVGDIDLVAPFYHEIVPGDGIEIKEREKDIDISEIEDEEDAELYYSNDFDERLYVNGFKVDLKISPSNKYEIIEYEGNKYRVSKLEHIMEAKWRYALQGSLKHRKDCYEISGKKTKK